MFIWLPPKIHVLLIIIQSHNWKDIEGTPTVFLTGGRCLFSHVRTRSVQQYTCTWETNTNVLFYCTIVGIMNHKSILTCTVNCRRCFLYQLDYIYIYKSLSNRRTSQLVTTTRTDQQEADAALWWSVHSYSESAIQLNTHPSGPPALQQPLITQ